MLFDLRGRGRRRTVQVIYLGLALIFLLGFIGFGVGVGGGGGGIINALTGEHNSGGASFSNQVNAALKRTRLKPNDPAAWAALIEAELHQAGTGEYFSEANQQYTGKGRELLNQLGQAWNTYLALEQHNPSVSLAKQMAQRVFVEQGLNQPAQAVQAAQIVIAAEPTSARWYGVLAEFSYKAHNTHVGDLAAAKAVSLAPAVDRKRIKKELEEIKSNPNATPGSSSSVPQGTYTTTQGGKTYTVKPGKNGTLTGQATTAVPPAGQTSTGKTGQTSTAKK
jgi:hypothetical protein